VTERVRAFRPTRPGADSDADQGRSGHREPIVGGDGSSCGIGEIGERLKELIDSA